MQKKFDGSASPKRNKNFKNSKQTTIQEEQQSVFNRKNLSTKLFEFANEVATSSKTFIVSTLNRSLDKPETAKEYDAISTFNPLDDNKTPESADFDSHDDEQQVRISGFDQYEGDIENKGDASSKTIGEHLAHDQYPYTPGIDNLIASNNCIVKGSRKE